MVLASNAVVVAVKVVGVASVRVELRLGGWLGLEVLAVEVALGGKRCGEANGHERGDKHDQQSIVHGSPLPIRPQRSITSWSAAMSS
jgi:hypothetical protein